MVTGCFMCVMSLLQFRDLCSGSTGLLFAPDQFGVCRSLFMRGDNSDGKRSSNGWLVWTPTIALSPQCMVLTFCMPWPSPLTLAVRVAGEITGWVQGMPTVCACTQSTNAICHATTGMKQPTWPTWSAPLTSSSLNSRTHLTGEAWPSSCWCGILGHGKGKVDGTVVWCYSLWQLEL